VLGGFLIIHAVTNIFILAYNLWTSIEISSPKKSKTEDLNISLVSPELPKINAPIIKQTPKKILEADPSSPKQTNTSALLDSTMDLLKWGSPKSKESPLSTSFLMTDSQIDDLLNSPNSSIFKAKQNLNGSKNDSKEDLGLSFYSNKSFLNSYDEKAQSRSLMNWTSGTNLNNSLSENNRKEVKERLSQQVYRLSTPPTSPRQKTSVFEKVEVKKSSTVQLTPYKFGWDKHQKIDKLKLWLNTHVISALADEIARINRTLKSKGIKTLEKFSYEHLNLLIHDENIIDSDKISSVEISHHRNLLEQYRAQIYRILPYFENIAAKNDPWEISLKRILELSQHGYLSCFDKEKDTQIIVNCILEWFNSKPMPTQNGFGLKPRSWFSNRYYCDYKHQSKDAWLIRNSDSNPNSEDGKIKTLLMHMHHQKLDMERNSRVSRIDILESSKFTTSELMDQLCPILVKHENNFLLIKANTEIHEFSSSLAVFEAFVALFESFKNTAVSHLSPV